MPYNILNCGGWETTGWVAGGGCIGARLGIVLLFFFIAILRKWGGEELGIPFSFMLSLIGGLGLYLIVTTFFGSFGWALIAGIIASLIAGYVGGMMGFGESE